MLAIFRKAMKFVHPDTYADYQRNRHLAPGIATGTQAAAIFPKVHGKNSFMVQPSRDPQNAPEWIRETTEFKMGVADGTIGEFISNEDGIRINWPDPGAGEDVTIPRATELPKPAGAAGATGTTIVSPGYLGVPAPPPARAKAARPGK